MQHWSDCATNNEPAHPKGDCDCGGITENESDVFQIVKNFERDSVRQWICPICLGKIVPSGFSGNLFCWGKCYCYLNTDKYNRLRHKAQREADIE